MTRERPSGVGGADEPQREAMARAKHVYERIFDATPDPIFVVSTALTIERANRAFLDKVGRPPSEVLGSHCVEVLHGILEPWGECLMARALRQHQPIRWTLPAAALGEAFECTTFPVDLADGRPAVAHHLRSVGDAAAGETVGPGRLDAVTASLIHELNNPLAAVLGFAEILEDSGACPPELLPDLRQIQQEARRCGRIIRNLLTLARAPRVERRPTDLRDLIERTIGVRSYQRDYGRIQVERSFSPDVPPVMVDPDCIEEILLNLLSNAQDAIAGARGTGRIRVTTAARAGNVEIEVLDDGPGIEPSHLPRLFEPLFTTKGAGKGTGLGLSISRMLARRHGGDIEARNCEGGGAAFTVRLPLIPAPDPPPATASGPGLAARTGRVLVLDDEPIVCTLLAKVLRGAGHTVAACGTPEEAARAIESTELDAVVADASLLEHRGAALRALLLRPGSPLAGRVVLMTGSVDRPSALAAELGGNPVLQKPFTSEQVRRAVGSVLRRAPDAKGGS